MPKICTKKMNKVGNTEHVSASCQYALQVENNGKYSSYSQGIQNENMSCAMFHVLNVEIE